MVLPIDEKADSKIKNQAESDYELLELQEFERVTDEAAAVRSVFGSPVKANDGHGDGTLPLVIIGYDQTKLLQILHSQRSDTELATRPICLIGVAPDKSDALIDQLADSVLPPRPTIDQLHEAKLILNMLSTQLDRLPLVPQDRPLTLLQYAHSRGSGIEPIVDGNAKLAYRYPLAEHILGMCSSETREILNDMASHSIFDRQHIDRIFTCPTCNSYRVTVKELCVECSSTNLKSQESIHHFRCGYVAPESEFMQSGLPICPKCNGEILHIGVEYNRPGQLVTCGECNFWATEPVLQAWCPPCNRYHNPGDLQEVFIHSYMMTRTASDIARIGSWDPSSHKNRIVHKRRTTKRKLQAAPEIEPRQSNRDAGYLEALTSVVLKIANEQGKPATVYSAQIDDISTNRSHDDITRLVDSVKSAIKSIARESVMCIEVQNDEMLVVLHDSPDRLTPTCRQIEQYVHRNTGISVSVIELSSIPDELHSSPARKRI